MIRQKEYMLRTTPDTHYVWVAGSCDYAHEERCSGGAYIMQLNDKTIESYAISDDHTTEFRMILSIMIHAMQVLPADSDIVFLTNVSYIQQNWDRHPICAWVMICASIALASGISIHISTTLLPPISSRETHSSKARRIIRSV